MARNHARPASLARLLDAMAQPVYAVDDEGQIAFANQVCLDWLGVAADELVGQSTAYHSAAEPGSTAALAAGLCPPPHLPVGGAMSGEVASPHDRRAATFIALPETGRQTPVLVVVAAGAISSASAAPDSAATPEQLHAQVRQLRASAVSRLAEERLLGQSPALRRARVQVELALASKASVLVVGPPGVGAEHVAAAIHYATSPPDAWLLTIDAAVAQPDAFRATQHDVMLRDATVGRGPVSVCLLAADRLSPELQADAAAIVVRGGLPVRLLATASGPLVSSGAAGSYSDELAAALSSIVIELPALAARREDIPLLAQAMLERQNARVSKQLGGFTPEALDRLDAYAWPGNTDELAQVITESHARAAGPLITAADLSDRLQWASQAAAHPRRKDEPIALDTFLEEVERELIRRALAKAKGNKARAARLLGLTRPRLYRRMGQLGLLDAS